MLRMRRGPPVDYRLCNQTVTIYHQISAGKEFRCTRTVFHGAFLDFKKVTAVEKTGSRETNSFLLVLPSGWSGALSGCRRSNMMLRQSRMVSSLWHPRIR